MKLVQKITLLSLAILVFSCKKKEDDEPFSQKLKIETNYYDINNTYVNQSSEKVITIASGTMVSFMYNIGGEEGFGSSDLKTEVTAFDYTKETASETVSCTLVPQNELANASMASIAVNEDTKFTFTITSKNGEKATVGPIEIKVKNNQEIVKGATGAILESKVCNNCYRFSAPLMLNGGYQGLYYNTDFPDFFNPEYVVFGAALSGGTMYLASPSQFDALGIYASLKSKYPCGWNTTSMQPYTGPINLDTDFSTINYQTLDTLTFTATSEKIVAAPSTSFIFKTAEGKKGMGKFYAGPFTDEISFTFAYQK